VFDLPQIGRRSRDDAEDDAVAGFVAGAATDDAGAGDDLPRAVLRCSRRKTRERQRTCRRSEGEFLDPRRTGTVPGVKRLTLVFLAVVIGLTGCGGSSGAKKNKTFGGSVPPPQPSTRTNGGGSGGTTTTSGY
jgi:hypothetical protein